MSSSGYGAVVIGGGVVGLAAAWHLLNLDCGRVALVERFRIGHTSGSSHGSARITRSTYTTAEYAGLMRHVRDHEWPRLERASGATLVHPGAVVFFGTDRHALISYAAAVQAAGVDVEQVPPAEARRRFPGLRFADDAPVLHDRTGGVIAAGDTMRALHRLVATAGGTVLEDTRVVRLDRSGRAIGVVTDRGILLAERAVIAPGPWLPDLVPVARGAVTVVPQTIAYFRLDAPARSLPSWVHLGGGQSGVTYGLAEVGRDAIKVGHHVTTGPGMDPDDVAPPPAVEAERLQRELGRILAVPVLQLLGSERCLYTMTSTEDFVIAHWPGDPRIAFASACSGHGFKFAPLTGRLLAELVVHGRANLPGDRDIASLFALRPNAATG